MRREADRRHLVLPWLAARAARRKTAASSALVKGRARAPSMTPSEQGGGCLCQLTIECADPRPEPSPRASRDRPGDRAQWAATAHHDDTFQRIAHPAPWAAVAEQRRRVARQRSRRIVGSRGVARQTPSWRPGPARGEPPHERAPYPDDEPGAPHGAIVVEDLDVAAMGKHGLASVSPYPLPGRDRPGQADARLQDILRGWAALAAAAGWPPSRTDQAAGATWPNWSSSSGCGNASAVAGWWTATPTRPVTFVTGPDWSPLLSMVNLMSSGAESPPRCRAWVTTVGRLTYRVGVRGPRRPPWWRRGR